MSNEEELEGAGVAHHPQPPLTSVKTTTTSADAVNTAVTANVAIKEWKQSETSGQMTGSECRL